MENNTKNTIKLKILSPLETLVDEEVLKVGCKGLEGRFTFLPRHIDYISAIVPSVVSYQQLNGEVNYVAVNEGSLTKTNENVVISVLDAIIGNDMKELEERVREEYAKSGEEEKEARKALKQLEYYIFDEIMSL